MRADALVSVGIALADAGSGDSDVGNAAGLPPTAMTELADRVLFLSKQTWGPERATTIIGCGSAMFELQLRVLQFAQAESPVLITGETGTGKELFARAVSLLSPRRGRAFLSVNCAQYQDGHLLASELFGHKKGSFTGAVVDRPGLFEDAHHGVLFLDEIGELPAAAQAMLLRVLSEGELIRVGENRPRRVDVRVVAATARDLEAQVASGGFREDLYYRLRFLRLRIAPLRERGQDWRMMVDHFLRQLNARSGTEKSFSASTLEAFSRYHWPGNVRELRSMVDLAYYATPGPVIEPESFVQELRMSSPTTGEAGQPPAPAPAPAAAAMPQLSENVHSRYARMRHGNESFWSVVYEPFMDRELNRAEVQMIVATGLSESFGSYKRMLSIFGIESCAYLRFMDFLRHHRLKPSRHYMSNR